MVRRQEKRREEKKKEPNTFILDEMFKVYLRTMEIEGMASSTINNKSCLKDIHKTIGVADATINLRIRAMSTFYQ